VIFDYYCECGHAWKRDVRGGSLPLSHPHPTDCPRCGSIYFQWKRNNPEGIASGDET